jgi:hypothetical protein
MVRGKADWVSITGTILTVVGTVVIFAILLSTGFPLFSTTVVETQLIDSSGNIGRETANILWNQRSLDLIAQAFLILASAACCVAMLRPLRRKED